MICNLLLFHNACYLAPAFQPPRQKYFEEEESSGTSAASSRRQQGPFVAHAQVAQVIGKPLPSYPDYSRKVSTTASIHSIKPASHQVKNNSIV